MADSTIMHKPIDWETLKPLLEVQIQRFSMLAEGDPDAVDCSFCDYAYQQLPFLKYSTVCQFCPFPQTPISKPHFLDVNGQVITELVGWRVRCRCINYAMMLGYTDSDTPPPVYKGIRGRAWLAWYQQWYDSCSVEAPPLEWKS